MLDLKEERRYSRLRKMAQELHIPMPEAFLTLEVFDKDGRLIQRHHQRSHSWVRNAYNSMFSNLAGVDVDDVTFGAGKLSGKQTDAVVKQGPRGWVMGSGTLEVAGGYGFLASSGDDTYGILVGSGENVESFENYVLQTPIADGTGAGQLSYVESEATDKSYAGLIWTHTLVRYFNNNTVGETSVDVNEVALVASCQYVGETPVDFFLYTRDKLASTVTVPSTGQLKVTYTIQLTYPS